MPPIELSIPPIELSIPPIELSIPPIEPSMPPIKPSTRPMKPSTGRRSHQSIVAAAGGRMGLSRSCAHRRREGGDRHPLVHARDPHFPSPRAGPSTADMRTTQGFPDHRASRSTMIATHVLRQGGHGIHSRPGCDVTRSFRHRMRTSPAPRHLGRRENTARDDAQRVP